MEDDDLRAVIRERYQSAQLLLKGMCDHFPTLGTVDEFEELVRLLVRDDAGMFVYLGLQQGIDDVFGQHQDVHISQEGIRLDLECIWWNLQEQIALDKL